MSEHALQPHWRPISLGIWRTLRALVVCSLFTTAYGAFAGALYAMLQCKTMDRDLALLGATCGGISGFLTGAVGGMLGGPGGWCIGGVLGGLLPGLYLWCRILSGLYAQPTEPFGHAIMELGV